MKVRSTSSPAVLVIGRATRLTCATASEKCQQEKRKTVNGEDILFAMTSLGFENYGEALKIYLARYREVRMSSLSWTSQPDKTAEQNLVARGENQKPVSGSSGAEVSPGYDAAGQPMLGNPMDPSGEPTTEFGYPVGPGGGGEF